MDFGEVGLRDELRSELVDLDLDEDALDGVAESGYYSLVEWMGTGLPYQICKHNREIRKKLLSQLMDLSQAQFEKLVGQLLAEIGFTKKIFTLPLYFDFIGGGRYRHLRC